MPHHAMHIRERVPLAAIQFINTRINRNEAEFSGISDCDADKPASDVDNMRLKHPGLLDRGLAVAMQTELQAANIILAPPLRRVACDVAYSSRHRPREAAGKLLSVCII
jgi:hypothetical protein